MDLGESASEMLGFCDMNGFGDETEEELERIGSVPSYADYYASHSVPGKATAAKTADCPKLVDKLQESAKVSSRRKEYARSDSNSSLSLDDFVTRLNMGDIPEDRSSHQAADPVNLREAQTSRQPKGPIEQPQELQPHDMRKPAPRTIRSTPKFDRPVLEILPGHFAQVCGSDETLAAYHEGDVNDHSCSACGTFLFCLASAGMCLCPECRSISPIDGGSTELLGLGVTLEVVLSQAC